MLSGICCLISLGFGIVMLVLDCTAGVYLMYRSYKKNSGTEFVIDSACRKRWLKYMTANTLHTCAMRGEMIFWIWWLCEK